MIKIESNNVDGMWILKIIGRMDLVGSKEAEIIFDQKLKGIKNVTLDCSELDYVSSAGLRLFRRVKFIVSKMGGNLVIKNIKPEVKSVFELTGFTDMFTFE